MTGIHEINPAVRDFIYAELAQCAMPRARPVDPLHDVADFQGRGFGFQATSQVKLGCLLAMWRAICLTVRLQQGQTPALARFLRLDTIVANRRCCTRASHFWSRSRAASQASSVIRLSFPSIASRNVSTSLFSLRRHVESSDEQSRYGHLHDSPFSRSC
jgi:hypothetical protein